MKNIFKTTRVINTFTSPKNIKHAYGVIESFKYLLQEQENQKTTSITYIDYKPENND